jgi:hypothetical protein
MSDDTDSDSSNTSSNGSSSTNGTGQDSLAAHKNQQANPESVNRANAGMKKTDSSDWETQEKSADKDPSGGNEIPSAEDISIPSSVDPNAPGNSGGDSADSSSGSENNQ